MHLTSSTWENRSNTSRSKNGGWVTDCMLQIAFSESTVFAFRLEVSTQERNRVEDQDIELKELYNYTTGGKNPFVNEAAMI